MSITRLTDLQQRINNHAANVGYRMYQASGGRMWFALKHAHRVEHRFSTRVADRMHRMELLK